MNFEKLLQSANTRLKAQNFKIKIARRGNTLYLRGYFPSKAEKYKLERQDISLGLTASFTGLQLAESEAIKIGVAVQSHTFSWEPYLKKTSKKVENKTAGDWIKEFEQNYFERRARNEQSELTWKKDYLAVFNKLDGDKLLTVESIEKTILKVKPDTRMRQRCCMVLGALAKFAKIEIDTNYWSGNYSYKKVKPRIIPDDETILKAIESIHSQKWQWVVGILSAYGLRNHEVFLINFDSLSRGDSLLKVNKGKTGFRFVYPIYPEWFFKFDLKTVKLPDINLSRSNDKLGATVSQKFRQLNLSFRPYDLRHAWAIRSLLYGVDVSLSAQMMGHSLKIHTETYQYWINEKHYREAFKLLKNC
ncbi:MAG: site-specific integrase [Cyanobacteria bacterium P01_D01_bin.50]